MFKQTLMFVVGSSDYNGSMSAVSNVADFINDWHVDDVFLVGVEAKFVKSLLQSASPGARYHFVYGDGGASHVVRKMRNVHVVGDGIFFVGGVRVAAFPGVFCFDDKYWFCRKVSDLYEMIRSVRRERIYSDIFVSYYPGAGLGFSWESYLEPAACLLTKLVEALRPSFWVSGFVSDGDGFDMKVMKCGTLFFRLRSFGKDWKVLFLRFYDNIVKFYVVGEEGVTIKGNVRRDNYR